MEIQGIQRLPSPIGTQCRPNKPYFQPKKSKHVDYKCRLSPKNTWKSFQYNADIWTFFDILNTNWMNISLTFWQKYEIQSNAEERVHHLGVFQNGLNLEWNVWTFSRTPDDADKSKWRAKWMNRWRAHTFERQLKIEQIHQNIRTVFVDPKANCEFTVKNQFFCVFIRFSITYTTWIRFGIKWTSKWPWFFKQNHTDTMTTIGGMINVLITYRMK